MSKNAPLRLILDNRETKLIDLLQKMQDKFLIEVKQLKVGDIIVSEDMVVERKTGADFIASIIDGRLFPQLMKMLDSYPNAILILESLNDKTIESTSMNLSSLYGALAYIGYKLGIYIIPTRHLDDTAIVLERLAYREQIEDVKPVMSRRAPKGMSIFDRRAFALEGLIDTGPKKAQLLIQKFGTPLKVFNAIKATKIVYTKTGKPKGIEGPLQDLSGFGWKYVQKNKELLIGKEIE